MNIAVFASGNGTDMQAIIDGCKKGLIDGKVVVVISNRKDANCLNRANKEEIPNYYLDENNYESEKEFSKEVIKVLKKHNTDIVFLAGYLKKIPTEIINAYDYNIYNIHPALLPKFGGKGMYGINVHKAVLEAGEKETGVTIHKVNKEYDKGEIIGQTKVPVLENDTPEVLAKRVLEKEHEFLVEILSKVAKDFKKV